MASSSIGSKSYGETGYTCSCNLPTFLFTSKIRKNPGRQFYRCKNFKDKSHDCGFFRWVDGGSISKSGDEVCSQSQSYRGMEKIVELESDFGDLVGCVSDLKDFQLAESTRLKLTSQAELRQLKEKVRHLEEAVHRLEEGERKREMKMDLLNSNQVLHFAVICIIFAALCYQAFWM